ncbi:EF-hand domain-containing protein [Hyphomicrobium sp.]|jgi:hypothetical protein|uniref:EF-hand domain-containing protein n=1 Tax=Hyphomicrobium sp. TaxID=82 RepID=UPI002BDEABBD|nr:EF-hand domain-containing protein [Hyphomicrobium sp.]HVZ04845.1 EF-hand domain-containing protein [Hyphomicrobium sp.]
MAFAAHVSDASAAGHVREKPNTAPKKMVSAIPYLTVRRRASRIFIDKLSPPSRGESNLSFDGYRRARRQRNTHFPASSASMSRPDLEALPLLKLPEEAPIARSPINGGRTVCRNGRRRHNYRTTYLGEDAMIKKWGALVTILLLSGTAAFADDWNSNFKVLDSNGNGSVSQNEWNDNAGKLKLGTFAPTFAVMDKDNSNSIDSDEWAEAQKIWKAASTSCKKAEGSWCPCQNHPEKPECH